MKDHPDFTEQWLRDRIQEDPTILGFGEVLVRDTERRQGRAGRLDLLLEDVEEDLRYEIELMLGAMDESHIIRCIEYWDIERRRYPAYDHVAVLIAEDVTSRFLNILSLMAGTIPLVVMQLTAIRVGDAITLSFVRVLDQRDLRRDDTVEAPSATRDRSYWKEKAGPALLGVIEEQFSIAAKRSEGRFSLNFTNGYIGISDRARGRLFIHWLPKANRLQLKVEVADRQKFIDEAKQRNLDARDSHGRCAVTFTESEARAHAPFLAELIQKGVDEYLGA